MEQTGKNHWETVKKYFVYFMLYSIIGWLYEVFLEVVVYQWGFSNRGVLFGPYCPVYGFGALIFLFAVYPLIRKKPMPRKLLWIPVVFVLCALTATAVELITSYLCEVVMGSWPWQTYAGYRYNFQARIALSPSIRFGIGGVFFLYIVQPAFEMAVKKLGRKGLSVVSGILGAVFLADLICFVVFQAIL